MNVVNVIDLPPVGIRIRKSRVTVRATRHMPWLRRPVATCFCGALAAAEDADPTGSRLPNTAARRRGYMLRRRRRSHVFRSATMLRFDCFRKAQA